MKSDEKIDEVLQQNIYIINLLENNPKTGQKGFINRLLDVEKDVEEIKVKDRVRIGKAGAVGAFATMALYWIGKGLIKIFF